MAVFEAFKQPNDTLGRKPDSRESGFRPSVSFGSLNASKTARAGHDESATKGLGGTFVSTLSPQEMISGGVTYGSAGA